jgi:hypothetical protein
MLGAALVEGWQEERKNSYQELFRLEEEAAALESRVYGGPEKGTADDRPPAAEGPVQPEPDSKAGAAEAKARAFWADFGRRASLAPPPGPSMAGPGTFAAQGKDPADLGAATADSEESQGEPAGATQPAGGDANPGPALLRLRDGWIPRERYEHVAFYHCAAKTPMRGPVGLFKSQFSPEVTRDALGTYRKFEKFVRSVLRLAKPLDQQHHNDGSLSLDLAWTECVGKVWNAQIKDWKPTDRMRVALAPEGGGYFFLKSIYPIP